MTTIGCEASNQKGQYFDDAKSSYTHTDGDVKCGSSFDAFDAFCWQNTEDASFSAEKYLRHYIERSWKAGCAISRTPNID